MPTDVEFELHERRHDQRDGTDIQTTFLTMGGGAGNDTLTNTGTLNFQVGGGTGSRVFTGDLVNSGTVNVNYDATFNKANGTYTNNGVLKISNGSLLDITNGGTLTNQSGSTLTGGTFDIKGTLRYAGAIVQTNQAEIILRGAGSFIRDTSNNDALINLATNGASGKLRVLEGRSFGTTAAYVHQQWHRGVRWRNFFPILGPPSLVIL